MEQKLAEFRARRQAANTNKMDKGDVSEKQEKPEALNPVIPSTDKEKVNTAQTQVRATTDHCKISEDGIYCNP